MRWKPAHDAHAIERVSLSLQFPEPIPSKPWQTLLNAAALEFPAAGFNVTLEEVEINIGQFAGGPGMRIPIAGAPGFAVGPGQMVQAPIAGRSFQRVVSNEVREEITLSRNGFAYAAVRYDGWASYRERAMSLLARCIDTTLPLVNLQLVKLEYWDRFVFQGPREEVDYAELLRRHSPYLPSFPYGSNQLWHSHVGLFVPSGTSARRLLNLNVDVLDLADNTGTTAEAPTPVGKRSVGIYSLAQDTFSSDGSPSDRSGLVSSFEGMHTILKVALAEVITPEASSRISLNPQAPA
ncbi:TIGR04255 family protein [Methylobacterium iners]|uniref:TIGR04255 family protein n=1 Tax=Methylobacterium iners TaxID=418707 RepID=A0ABQ4S385_9HYPH|nr:TIGR04255 family protein [Methylobacterium iners]GJD96913.1 hypothetical protein OCOJLMKI_4140 [Methylobacterium iners]